ncbi:MAG: HD-GYP domain-containing protein [Desulfobacca sp.]|uniref:HD-GYP domain-containing protein n=1 Tax=Desulfobacca sp. TaxID=2067990 RepID=UPI0040491B9E
MTQDLAAERVLLEKQKLIEISIALTSETDLHRLLSRIITELRGLTRAQGGSLYLVAQDRLTFEVAQNEIIAQALDSELLCFRCHDLPIDDKSLAGYVALTGRLLNIADVYELSADLPYHFDPSFDRRTGYRTHSMLVAPLQDHQGEIVGVLQLINATGADGAIRPFSREDETLVLALASQGAVAINNVRLVATIKNLFEALVVYSVSAIDARSPHTAGHSRRVAAYSLALAQAVNACQEGPLAEVAFSEPEMEELRFSAWLHDIGKIGVRDALLDKKTKLTNEQLEAIRWRFRLACWQSNDPSERQALTEDLRFLQQLNTLPYLPPEAPARLARLAAKRLAQPDSDRSPEGGGMDSPLLTGEELAALLVSHGNLTSQEYSEIQGHALQTLHILEKIPFSKPLAQVPRLAACHHERLDGTGYPFGLTAAELPYQARILAIADVFDALTASDRPYRLGASSDHALHVLRQEAAQGRLDEDLVEVFIARRVYEAVLSPAAAPA